MCVCVRARRFHGLQMSSSLWRASDGAAAVRALGLKLAFKTKANAAKTCKLSSKAPPTPIYHLHIHACIRSGLELQNLLMPLTCSDKKLQLPAY